MPIISNRKKNFFLSFGFGANFGYEHSSINMVSMRNIEFTEREKKIMQENIYIENDKGELIKVEKPNPGESYFVNTTIKNRFLYGLFVGLETEIFLSNRFILILNTKARYLRKSFIKDFQLNYGIGFKYILNY
jgi:hypothetical protein